MRILLAEDDPLTTKSLTYFLNKKKYEVVNARDGKIAQEYLKKENFDLIITDLNMPRTGGLELINIIRTELHLDTPIIVLTASGVEQSELDAFAIGASEFISKPFSPSVLHTRIQRLVSVSDV